MEDNQENIKITNVNDIKINEEELFNQENKKNNEVEYVNKKKSCQFYRRLCQVCRVLCQYPTVIMALLALVTLIFSIWQSNHTERRHINELELARLQQRYEDISEYGDVWYSHEVFEHFIELENKLRSCDDYNKIANDYNSYIYDYAEACGKFRNIMLLYHIPYNFGNENNDIISVNTKIEKYLYDILDVINFFKLLPSNVNTLDKKIQKIHFDSAINIVKSTSYKMNTITGKMVAYSMRQYCEDNNYEYDKIRDNIWMYMNPIIHIINREHQKCAQYYLNVLYKEREKIDSICNELGVAL